MTNTKETIHDFKRKYHLRDEFGSRPNPTDEEIIKTLEQKDTIPFVSGLENYGLSIVEIVPIYFQDGRSLISRLKNRNCVTTAKDLERQFIPEENSPSRISLLGNKFSNVPGYVLIHAPMPDYDEDYKVNTYEKDFQKGLENIPVSHVIPENLMKYLKSVNL